MILSALSLLDFRAHEVRPKLVAPRFVVPVQAGFLCTVPFSPEPRVSPAMCVCGISGDPRSFTRIFNFAILAKRSEKRLTPWETSIRLEMRPRFFFHRLREGSLARASDSVSV